VERLVLDSDLVAEIQAAPFDKVVDLWQHVIELFGVRGKAALGRCDRFYLLTHLLHRPDAINPWLYERCREVEAEPDECLDLWARFHYKSTIITFAGIIQEILIDPEITIAILCYVKSLSSKMLGQIKSEFENNEELKQTYSDVLWQNPRLDATREGCSWTQYRIDVKRKTNPKEGTLEAHGLTDGMPTGAHFALRVYDDVVVRESTTSPEMVAKTTECWELSDNLKSSHSRRRWHIGTRYSFADTYGEILERGILKPRIYPATDDGTPNGKPVFLSPDLWEETKITQRTTLSAQMLQNPSAGNEAMFKKEELRFIDIRPGTLNVYIMVDPASSKKKGSDRTAMAVIGVDALLNKYLLDGYCHKMSLPERWVALSQLRKHWLRQPGVQGLFVGYERFGMRSDLEHFEEKMQAPGGEHFEIKELSWPQDTPAAKADRIQRLVPDFGYGKFFLPAIVTQQVDGKAVPAESTNQRRCRENGEAYKILKPTKRRDHEGNVYSLNKMLLDEYLVYPFSKHDDFLDCVSRLYDMEYKAPIIVDQSSCEPEVE
jgi:hypothetical protein